MASALPPIEPGIAQTGQVLRRAADLDSLGRRLDAILILRRALVESPDDAALYGQLAHLLEAAGESDAALEALTAGVTATGADAVRTRRGGLLVRLNRHAEAEADLQHVLTSSSPPAEAFLHLGVSFLRRGRHHEALPMLAESVRRAPDLPEAVFHLGEAWYQAGDLTQAQAVLERAAVLAPHDPRAYKLLGRLLDRLGRTEEAMSLHRKAREAGAP